MFLANVLIEGLLQVLALIGIVLTAGFLIFFIGDLLLAVLDPKYESILKRGKRKNRQKREELGLDFADKKQIEYTEPEVAPNPENLQLSNIDYDKALQEENEIKQKFSTDTEDHQLDQQLLEEEEDFKRQSYNRMKERTAQNFASKRAEFNEEEYDESFFDFDDDNSDDDVKQDSDLDMTTEKEISQPKISKDEDISFDDIIKKSSELQSTDISSEEIEKIKNEFEDYKKALIKKLKEEGDWDD